MSYVGKFDIGMQLSEVSLQKILQGQHATGIFLRRGIRYVNEWRYDFIMNAPDVELIPSESNLHCILRTHLFVLQRIAGDVSSVGNTCVLDANIPVQIDIGNGADPEILGSNTILHIDYSGTDLDDIDMHPPSEAARSARTIMREVAQEFSPQNERIPQVTIDGVLAKSMSTRFIEYSGKRYINVGFNVRNSSSGDRSDLTVCYTNRDWAVAMSPSYFLSIFESKLDETLSLPYRISRRCTITAPWPFTGCWNYEIAKLTSLSVSIEATYIRLDGHIHVRNTGALVPDVNVTFNARVTLSVTSSGVVNANIGTVNVDIVDWYADIFDFVSGGTLKSKISTAIRNALQTNAAGGFGSLITPTQLLELLSIGTTSSLELDLIPKSVSISTQGIAVQGDIIVEPQHKMPEAKFVVIPTTNERRFIFNAVKSIAPGGTIREYRWQHADGSNESFTNLDAKFITEKTFGRIRKQDIKETCLQVIDERGQVSQICVDPITLPPVGQDSLLFFSMTPSNINMQIPNRRTSNDTLLLLCT